MVGLDSNFPATAAPSTPSMPPMAAPAPASMSMTAPSMLGPMMAPNTAPATFGGPSGLVPFKSVSQLNAEQKAKSDAEEAADAKTQLVERNLAGYVKKCYQAAKSARRYIELDMLHNLRQRNGEYESDKLASIVEQGGSTIYMLLTDEKCTAALAWMKDALLQDEKKPWSIRPTPRADLDGDEKKELEDGFTQAISQFHQLTGQMPDAHVVRKIGIQLCQEKLQQLQEEASKYAENMESVMYEQTMTGGFSNAFAECLDNICTFPAGFLKGPIFRNKKDLSWGKDGKPIVEEKTIMEYEAPSPFDIYPSPGSRTIDDGFIIERHRFTRRDLTEMKGLPGYNDEEIQDVLDNPPAEGWDDSGIKSARDIAEGRMPTMDEVEDRIYALEFWGDVSGKLLLQWGMDDSDIPDADAEYQCCVLVAGGCVLRTSLNPDPLGRKPYYKSCFREKLGGFWGKGIPQLVRDIQDGCNDVARALFNNVSLASGPQTVVDISKVPSQQQDEIPNLYPWKIHMFDGTKPSASSAAPITFFQPDSRAKELSVIYDEWEQKADNKTGIPKYTYGGQTGGSGALATATGFAQMMANATKALKAVIKGVDVGIIEPMIDRLYTFNMLFNDEIATKGDIHIQAIGSESLLMREQLQLRRNEFMQLILASPAALNTIEPDGLATMLREMARDLQYPKEVIPTVQEVQQKMQQQQKLQQQMLAQQQAQQGQLPPGAHPAPGGPPLPPGAPASPGQPPVPPHGQGPLPPQHQAPAPPAKPATMMASGDRAGGVDARTV